MTKGSKKNTIIKSYYVKDRAIVKFILSHSKKQHIDYSKIKIPSFIDIIDNKEGEENCKKNNFYSNTKNIDIKGDKIMKPILFPTFNFCSLKELNLSFINNNESTFKSTLFNQ